MSFSDFFCVIASSADHAPFHLDLHCLANCAFKSHYKYTTGQNISDCTRLCISNAMKRKISVLPFFSVDEYSNIGYHRYK